MLILQSFENFINLFLFKKSVDSSDVDINNMLEELEGGNLDLGKNKSHQLIVESHKKEDRITKIMPIKYTFSEGIISQNLVAFFHSYTYTKILNF